MSHPLEVDNLDLIYLEIAGFVIDLIAMEIAIAQIAIEIAIAQIAQIVILLYQDF